MQRCTTRAVCRTAAALATMTCGLLVPGCAGKAPEPQPRQLSTAEKQNIENAVRQVQNDPNIPAANKPDMIRSIRGQAK